jgi:hypothetical protein
MCFPNFLQKRGESEGSSLEARLVDDADFLNTTMGRGRGYIGLRHTWWWQERRGQRSGTCLHGSGLRVRKRETSGQQTCGSNHTGRAVAGGARRQDAIGPGRAAQRKATGCEARGDAEDVRRGSSVGRGAQEVSLRRLW